MVKKRSIPFILLFFSSLCCCGRPFADQRSPVSISFDNNLFDGDIWSRQSGFSPEKKIKHIFTDLRKHLKMKERLPVENARDGLWEGPPLFQDEQPRPDMTKKSVHAKMPGGRGRFRSAFFLSISLFGMITMIMIYMMWCHQKRKHKNIRKLTIQSEQFEAQVKTSQEINKNQVHLIKLVAHDLRNPIGAMGTIASMMMEKALSEDLYELVQLMDISVQSSLNLVNGLLDVDFDEQQDLHQAEIPLDDLLEPCVHLLQLKAKAKGQHLVYHNNLQLSVWADKEKIWRVINNLIGNAIKFSPEGSNIHIMTQREISGIVISILDQGIGIPATLQSEIFQPFSPAKRSGTKGEKPFGLGLYISKQIMEAHQGRIWFRSERDLGTEFFIELPFHN